MIRRATKVQLLVFLLITVLGVSYVSTRYVGLGERLFGDGYVVQVDLAESGGIFSGAEVTYRGVQVGRVGALKLAKDGVLVDLKIEGGTEVPKDTRAVVENRSAVGEQYVDLQPRREGGPYLAGGDRIARVDTATPLPVETLLLDLDRLVRSVDRRDLAVTIDELGKAFSGTGQNLQRMIDSGDALTKEATDALPETIRLIEDGRTVLDTQRETGSSIRSFSRDLRTLSATLRKSDGDLRKILDNGVVASQQLRRLFRENRPAIGALLGNLLTTGQITVARLDGVEQVLATYPVNVSGGYTVVPGDGTSHFGLVMNASDPPACQKGYGGTDRRSPHATADTRANTDARCTEPRGSETSVRGAQRAPGPDGGSAAALPGGWAAAGDAVRTSADVSDGAVSSSYLTGYDSASGVARGPGGAPLRIGARGGQAETFGKDSWQWLLLGPLGR